MRRTGAPRCILGGVRPAVFRGIGVARAAVRVASLVTLYVGGFAVLWGLGLVVRGWQGWTILGAPLAALVGARLWAWRRVSVEVTENRVRYEGAVPARDWEIPLERVEAVYFDRALPGSPLVLAVEGDERVCGDLSTTAARALFDHLTELGVPAPRASAG